MYLVQTLSEKFMFTVGLSGNLQVYVTGIHSEYGEAFSDVDIIECYPLFKCWIHSLVCV